MSTGITNSLGDLRKIREERNGTSERPGVQTLKRAGGQSAAQPGVQTAKPATGRSGVQASGRSDVQAASRTGLPLQGTAKRNHPDFAKKTLYVRKATMRDAMRRYEDAGGEEESELVELLLRDYAKGGFRA